MNEGSPLNKVNAWQFSEPVSVVVLLLYSFKLPAVGRCVPNKVFKLGGVAESTNTDE